METLYAYALILCEGYDYWDVYSEELDRLFLNDPENDMYLSLELTTDIHQAVFHIFSSMNWEAFDVRIFGKALMKPVSDIYKKSNLQDFTEHMYSLWNHLPYFISEKEPFFIFNYAGDSLSYGDEIQCRKLCEKAMNFYG